MNRRPGNKGDFTFGLSTNMPFQPGGLDLESRTEQPGKKTWPLDVLIFGSPTRGTRLVWKPTVDSSWVC